MRRATNPKKEKPEPSKTITFRLPISIIDGLEAEAEHKEISTNVLAKQIFSKYLSWDRYSDRLQIIPVPKKILGELGDDMDGNDINQIITALKPVIKESVLFIKGAYDLKRCIETLEDYMRASGMRSDHRIEGPLHHFIIQHELGMSWSLFTEQLLKEIFHEFLPDKNLKCNTSEHTVVATISLGEDFSEHTY